MREMSKEMKSCFVYSKKNKRRSVGCIRVKKGEQEKEMNLEGEPHAISDKEFGFLSVTRKANENSLLQSNELT